MKKHDPETFARCNTPRPAAEASAAIEAFSAAVAEARKAYGIGNVYVVVEALVEGEGDEGPSATCAVMHLGDTSRSEELAAFAFGYETRKAEKRRAQFVGHGMAAAGVREGAEGGRDG